MATGPQLASRRGLLGALLLALSSSGCDQKPSFYGGHEPPTPPLKVPASQSGDASAAPSDRPPESGATATTPSAETLPAQAAAVAAPKKITASGIDSASTAGDFEPPRLPAPPASPGAVATALPVKTKTISQLFGPKRIDSFLLADLATGRLSESLVLQRRDALQSEKIAQITRTDMVDSFQQGNSGTLTTETFAATTNRTLDIVAVTDNSVSMGDKDASGQTKQARVAARVMDLLSELGDTDWQIGIVTTDPGEGALRRLVKKSDPDVAQAFADGWNAGTSGSDNERGILQAVRSLAGFGLPAPWLRPNSQVAVLIVSDEDNCSAAAQPDGGGPHQDNCPGKAYASGAYLVSYLNQIRQVGKTARAYGIIWGPEQSQDQCPAGFNPGIEYAKAIAATGGVYGSICDADYAPTLRRISADIQGSLTSNFTLAFEPVANSLSVAVNGKDLDSSGFQVNGSVVTLKTPAPQGAQVRVTYRHDPSPVVNRFPLRATPFAGSTVATIDGQLQDQSSFAIASSGGVSSVTFAKPPAENAAIRVSYKVDQPLLKDFALSKPPLGGSLTVSGGGVTLGTYQVKGTILTFSSPPPEGLTMTVSYTSVGDPVVGYTLSGLPAGAAPQNLAAIDSDTGAAVPVNFQGGLLAISPADVQIGRRLMVSYDNPAHGQIDLTLPADPLPNSVKITAGGVTCDQQSGLVITGRHLTVVNCPVPSAVATARIDFSYLLPASQSAASLQDLDFTAAPSPDPGTFQQWTVAVNDLPTTNFTRSGLHFHLNQAISATDTVKIELLEAAP